MDTSKLSAEEWFKNACYLASSGKPKEAEMAIKRALSMRDNYPIAWAILSAICLSQGRETDAEQAGKKAITQCKNLKMTWPKMRSIIFSKGIKRGSSWKEPRRVIIHSGHQTEWSQLLSTLGEASSQDVEEIDASVEDVERQDAELEPLKYEPKGHVAKVPESRPEPAKPKSYLTEETRSHPIKRVKGFHSAEERFTETLQSTMKETKKEQAEVWFTSAYTYLKRGNLEQAEEAFLKGLDINPANGEVLRNSAEDNSQ